MSIKKGLYLACFILLMIVAIWWICGAGSEDYTCKGYVTQVNKTKTGTVITVLSGEKESEFTIKWYTRKKVNGELKPIEAGNCILLSTTKNSDTNIKKFSAYEGYQMSGKLVYAETLSTPFLLTRNEFTKALRLYSIISAEEDGMPMENGTPITIYYQYPINAGNTTIVVDIVQQTSDTAEAFTEAELTYIATSGYTLATE